MTKLYAVIAVVVLAAGTAFFTFHNKIDISAINPSQQSTSTKTQSSQEIKVVHIKTPDILEGLYLTYYSFESATKRNGVVSELEDNGFNSLIIDIRSNGQNLFDINNEKVISILSDLHNKNIYLIARLVAFKNGSNAWYDPGSKDRWNQISDISKQAYDMGFDEINYDYIRYGGPTEIQSQTPISDREPIIHSFYDFLNKEVRQKYGITISGDVFGTTFINPEAGIGQKMQDAIENFDYIMPMPYPSHWALGTFGIAHPGNEPYQVVYQALTTGWSKIFYDPNRIAKLRSWIQAFGIESISPWKLRNYTPADIQAQVKACYDAGCIGWVLWNGFSNYETDYSVPGYTPPIFVPQMTSSTSATTTKNSGANK